MQARLPCRRSMHWPCCRSPISRRPEQKYFVDGLTDALIEDLSKIGGALRVISRTSTEAYATAPKPIKEIARELGVDAIVEGSVARRATWCG